MRHVSAPRPRWWLALVQAVLLVASLVVPATVSAASLSGAELIQMLNSYGVVKGDENGNLNLDKPITRAEMFTIIVRSVGGEENSDLFKGLSPFSDTRGHWAEGYIAYAAAKGLVKGDGDGKVRPDDQVNYGEALTLVLRVIGQEPTTGDWPYNVFLSSVNLGLVPEGVTSQLVKSPAIRGLAFQSLGQAVTTQTLPDGRTYLQAYIDSTPPTISVTGLPEQTDEAALTVKVLSPDAKSVTINGMAATGVGGTFTVTVALTEGANSLSVVAVDAAGNKAIATYSVNRGPGIASISINGPAKLVPGGTAAYSFTATDTTGASASTAGAKIDVTGSLGTYNTSTGVLQVAQAPGTKGSLTATLGGAKATLSVEIMGPSSTATRLSIAEVNGGVAVSYTKPMTVTVQVLNADGTLAEDDYGRTVGVSASGTTGLSVSPKVATTEAGIATFTVSSQSQGTVSLSASSTGLTSGTASAAFGSTNRIRLSADPANLVVGSSITIGRIKAELVDENGTAVNNTGDQDIRIQISSSGTDGSVVDNSLTIVRGRSSSTLSGNDGLFQVGNQGGSVTIQGSIQQGPAITVDPVGLTVTVPVIGSGSKLKASAQTVLLQAGNEARFFIQVVDANGNPITTGNYAFQVKVDSSVGEEKVNGIPEGMTVQLGDTGLNPVSDGIAESASDDTNDVIARTLAGSAVIKLIYDKPGTVTLTPIAVGSTNTAYDSNGDAGVAAYFGAYGVESDTMTYQGTVADIQVSATSNVGTGAAASILNSTGSTATLNVTLVDGQGYWVPNQSQTVTLTRLSGTSTTPPTSLTATTVNGKTSFTIRGTTTAGTDVYAVTTTVGGNPTTATATVQVVSAAPGQPSVAAVRGMKDGIPGLLNYVAPDDDEMEIELWPLNGSEWVQVKVYAYGTSSPIFTSDPLDISVSAPKVTVPKSKLSAGSRTYQIVVRNGYGDSAKSAVSESIVNATYTTGVVIGSARYDVVAKKLYIYGSGFYSADTLDVTRLSAKDTSTGAEVFLSDAVLESISSSTIVLNLSASAVPPDLEDGTMFSGTDVSIQAASGWYTKSNGQVASPDTSGNALTPAGYVSYAVHDSVNKRIHLYGAGFTTGTLDYTKLQLVAGTTTYTLSSYSPTRISDTELRFTLNTTVNDAVLAESAFQVVANSGWLKSNTAYNREFTGADSAPIYAKITTTSVQYSAGVVTITGSGFTGGAVDKTKIKIVDLSAAPLGLLLSNATSATATSATTIQITLSTAAPDDKGTFEGYSGNDIYLVLLQGWFTDANGRSSAASGERDLRFPTQ